MGFARAGSNPAGVAILLLLSEAWGISSIGRARRSQRRGTGTETRILHRFSCMRVALVAQMVERKTLNLVVVGSIPTEGVTFLFSGVAPVA